MSPDRVAETIVALERAALDRWCKGDPYGFADNALDDVTYFDHMTKPRIEGVAAFKDHMRQFVNKVDVPRYEILTPGFAFGFSSMLRARGSLGLPIAT